MYCFHIYIYNTDIHTLYKQVCSTPMVLKFHGGGQLEGEKKWLKKLLRGVIMKKRSRSTGPDTGSVTFRKMPGKDVKTMRMLPALLVKKTTSRPSPKLTHPSLKAKGQKSLGVLS